MNFQFLSVVFFPRLDRKRSRSSSKPLFFFFFFLRVEAAGQEQFILPLPLHPPPIVLRLPIFSFFAHFLGRYCCFSEVPPLSSSPSFSLFHRLAPFANPYKPAFDLWHAYIQLRRGGG
uniref:Putative secreted protein n=1 Tax=Amblyomma triste TaxID=251400 RepID=A0A023G241_AMBTT